MDEKGDNAIGMDDDTPDAKIADKPALRVSLKERLAEMKVKVAGNSSMILLTDGWYTDIIKSD